ncbi:ATP-dependent nuclease [Mycolicibacterium mucogenicum]|uniref:AAA+ ATPase domain-containing protein n=2 Tax=Mycolicibacterium mucogenicum DSM 44124 TaxID=1226753 RepID=A0A8E4RA98_MYCMU|nr:TOPRIM nucleotidyl transferase/hydrolase domain-containing protein [Mycolicibacterium mucogenicum]QPG70737.1 hypothetical protein C1S78_007190 [Mycolicibacterium mucogenicum DSM 44124]
MRLLKVYLYGYRSVEFLDFEAGPFTVLFGKNNVGKTNVLEALLGLLNPEQPPAVRGTPSRRNDGPSGAVYVQLEPGLQFDEEVMAAAVQATGTRSPRRVAFTGSGLLLADPNDYSESGIVHSSHWRGATVEGPNVHALSMDWEFRNLHNRVEASIERLVKKSSTKLSSSAWLEPVEGTVGRYSFRSETRYHLDQFSSLATDLLPDFVGGRINAFIKAPEHWDTSKISIEYVQDGQRQCSDEVDTAGHGAARWIAAASQLALHLMDEFPGLHNLRDAGPRGFSGHILVIDEPEAHLHPMAVESIVRWCQQMVMYGFNVVVASHHEEFLRAPTDDVTLVHITRDQDLIETVARTLPVADTRQLQELAADVGVHPATALSLNRGILFVEGPLDEAVLDEYGGAKLDAAGVKIVPIHGTKNLEGLISAELVTKLGMKFGILTDATVTATMRDRSGNKRSSEERKVLRVLQIAEERGLPVAMSFGVPEADLLFALPAEAIREYLRGPFPEWEALVAECRVALNKGPSDSVNWKAYAYEKYGLPITTPGGVRSIVRKLDLDDVELPSIRAVVEEIVAWATTTAS